MNVIELNTMTRGAQNRIKTEARQQAELNYVLAIQVGAAFGGKVNKAKPKKLLPDLYKENEPLEMTEDDKRRNTENKWRQFFNQ